MLMTATLMLGNCLDKMKDIDDNSVDSIVTDPPYGLSFMGKKWDYDVPSTEIWEEAFRVLKPGGFLLSFAGTRTQHRMAIRIEDAGFEIRDMIAWIYGSGFPKSMNIGKAIDDVKQWEGWGTALKPALEPITVARKPIEEKNVAANVLKYGTGGINIDASRVKIDPELDASQIRTLNSSARYDDTNGQTWGMNKDKSGTPRVVQVVREEGRFPANLIHDGSEEVTELMGESARFFYCPKISKADRDEGLDAFEEKSIGGKGNGIRRVCSKCGASSLEAHTCHCEEKDWINPSTKKNNHPTVKPTDLMRYLVRMVTPKDGTVLDPFMGSGSTGKAAKLERFNFIGIELDAEYFEIAKARIEDVKEETTLEEFFK
jgi:DNA modification methylase